MNRDLCVEVTCLYIGLVPTSYLLKFLDREASKFKSQSEPENFRNCKWNHFSASYSYSLSNLEIFCRWRNRMPDVKDWRDLILWYWPERVLRWNSSYISTTYCFSSADNVLTSRSGRAVMPMLSQWRTSKVRKVEVDIYLCAVRTSLQYRDQLWVWKGKQGINDFLCRCIAGVNLEYSAVFGCCIGINTLIVVALQYILYST